ncbi:MAG: hypothetical protein IJ382_03030 [Flavobacteriales bacterium]|nr:hypothetical protein [Flavobacteriales bacterium]
MSLFRNLLTSQLMPYGGIISLMQWDNTLFDGMVLPNGVDKGLVIDTIMQKYGDSPLDHEDPAYLKYYIPVWSKRNLDSWTKLFATLSFDYNPLENTLLDETTEETRSTDRNQDRTGTASMQNSGTTGVNKTAEHLVSAENASDYQPDNRDNGTEQTTVNQTTGTDSTENTTEQTAETVKSTYNRHGSIGVVTPQNMIQQEREVDKFVIYDYIADSFRDAFCLLLY